MKNVYARQRLLFFLMLFISLCILSTLGMHKVGFSVLNQQLTTDILVQILEEPLKTSQLLCAFLLLLYYRYRQMKLEITHGELAEKVSALFCSIFMLIGFYSDSSGNGPFSTIFRSWCHFLLSVCYVIGCSTIIEFFFTILKQIIQHSLSEARQNAKKLLVCYASIIFICWLPYMIIRYPGGIEWDASHQIMQFL